VALGAERSRPAVRAPRAAEADNYSHSSRRSQSTGGGRNFGSTCHSRLARRTSWCSPRHMNVPHLCSHNSHTAEKSAAARAGTVATAVARAGAGDHGRGDGRAQGQTRVRRPSRATTFGQKTHATLFPLYSLLTTTCRDTMSYRKLAVYKRCSKHSPRPGSRASCARGSCGTAAGTCPSRRPGVPAPARAPPP